LEGVGADMRAAFVLKKISCCNHAREMLPALPTREARPAGTPHLLQKRERFSVGHC
jgi:hypothetical protein